MPDKKKQHFVPKLYLKNFSNDGYFFLYNVIRNELLERIPYKSQCFSNYFYGKDLVYEEKLANLEGNWDISITNIIDDYKKIKIEDIISLKNFCCFQWLRTEKKLYDTIETYKDIEDWYMKIVNQYKNLDLKKHEIRTIINNKYDSEERIKIIKNLLYSGYEFSEELNDLDFKILYNKTKNFFITSDNPILINNNFQPFYGIGGKCAGIFFMFPISEKIYILLYDKKMYPNFSNKTLENIDISMVHTLNVLQYINCHKNIFSKNKETIRDLINLISSERKRIKIWFRNQNNFLSNEAKKVKEREFESYVNIFQKENNTHFLYPIARKNLYKYITVRDDAKPFSNRPNYVFFRNPDNDFFRLKVSFFEKQFEDFLSSYFS